GQQQRPLPFRSDANHLRFPLLRHAGDGEAAHPAGGGVVWMMLAAGRFLHDLRISPTDPAKMHRKSDARQPGGGRRSTALPDGNIIRDLERERSNWSTGSFKHLAVGVQDEVILKFSTDVAITAACR